MTQHNMKAIKNLALILFSGTLLLCSCMNDNPDLGQDDENEIVQGEGQASFASVKLEVNVAVTTKGETVNTDNYIIQIYSAKTNLLVKEYLKYSQMPEIITLGVGEYRIEALSHELKPVEWEKPFYRGSQTFMIKKDEVTLIDAIKCSLQNIMVTVSFSEDLKTLLKGDQSVTVSIGKGEVTYNNEDLEANRAAYFEAAEASNVLLAKFQGTVDGEWVQMTESFVNVKGGTHKNIVFSLKIPPVGDMGLSFKIDAVCKDIDLVASVKPGDDDILPEDPSVNPGPANGPTIVGVGFNIMDEILVPVGDTRTVIVNITADNGIQNLKIKIDSETLTPDILNSVGLSAEFDLANPGSEQLETALKGLGFPVGSEVIGVKSLVFDITSFTPLLGMYGVASHNFIITVVDQEGSTKMATLALKSVLN